MISRCCCHRNFGKRSCQKSLPSSLFQREESFWGFNGELFHLFPLWKRGILWLFKKLNCYKFHRMRLPGQTRSPEPLVNPGFRVAPAFVRVARNDDPLFRDRCHLPFRSWRTSNWLPFRKRGILLRRFLWEGMANFLVTGTIRSFAFPRRGIVTSSSVVSSRSRCGKDFRALRIVSFFILSSLANYENG
jgi:hypothetical protein